MIIYHANCIDGFTAAWVAYGALHGFGSEFVAAQYGDEPPDVAGKDVLILDFSYPRATLLEMHATARSLRVIDHHKTAQADLDGLPFCVFDVNRSGAGLTWDELYPGIKRPLLVDYVEDRDLWRWSLPQSREISAWLSSFKREFEGWTALGADLEHRRESCVSQGQAILRSLDVYVECNAQNFRIGPIGGHEVPVINTTYAISELIGTLAELPDVPFAAGWFQRQDGKFVYSLRSRGDFDVSAVAKKYGGGGHKNSAGFTVDRLVHE
jgi:hypothetical protein